MEVKEFKTKNLVIGAVIGSVLMLFLWIASGFLQNTFDGGKSVIDKGVTITVNDDTFSDVALSEFGFSLKKGDRVALDIPYDKSLDGGKTIMILLYLCGVEANVGNHLVYSYGMNYISEDRMVGSGYHFIDLPDDLEGRDVHIDIYVNENGAFTSIDEINCIDSDLAYRFFAARGAIGLAIGVFLSGLGFILVLAGLIATFFDRSFSRLPLIGAFAMLMGLWSFSSQKTFQLFTQYYETWTLLEYILLYLAPVPLLAMIYTMRRDRSDWKKWVLLVDLLIYSAFVITCIVLHFMNVVRLPKTLVYFHMQGAVVLVVAVVVGVFMVRNKTRGEVLFQLAIFVLCGAIGIDLLRFNLQKYLWPNSDLMKLSILPIATLVFILILLLSYIMHLYDLMMTRTEKEMLTQLAYHDILTGLYNRTRANERFAELEAGKEEYCLISLDCNGLKYINDTKGHEEGDKMLKTFAVNLHEAFKGVGKCYRMGGDEFLAIVRKRAFQDVDNALRKLEAFEKKESAIVGFEFDASYGIAYSREVEEGNPEKIYSLADDRMYKMKLQKHNSRAARENKAEQNKTEQKKTEQKYN